MNLQDLLPSNTILKTKTVLQQCQLDPLCLTFTPGFMNPGLSFHEYPVAQWQSLWTGNHKVIGSTPIRLIQTVQSLLMTIVHDQHASSLLTIHTRTIFTYDIHNVSYECSGSNLHDTICHEGSLPADVLWGLFVTRTPKDVCGEAIMKAGRMLVENDSQKQKSYCLNQPFGKLGFFLQSHLCRSLMEKSSFSQKILVSCFIEIMQ